MTSSSPRAATHFDAVLIVRENAVGPIMLPEKEQLAFVAEFNATYGSIGMTIRSIAELHDRDSTTDEQGASTQQRNTQELGSQEQDARKNN